MTPDFIAQLKRLKHAKLLEGLVKSEPPACMIGLVCKSQEPIYQGPHFSIGR